MVLIVITLDSGIPKRRTIRITITGNSCYIDFMKPDPASRIVDLDFISIRHKLLDVAAFLDRTERAGASGDFRVQALREALPLLTGTGANRTRQILEHFSDPSEAPIDHAPGKGACGAVPREKSP